MNFKKLIATPIFFITTFYSILTAFFYNKVLFTPDFGSSDAYHVNYAAKYFLAQNYHHFHIPFWTNLLQGGFPFIAESQTGAFNLLNLFLLSFLPFSLAYPLLYTSSLFLLTLGFYLILTEIKLNKWYSLLLALNFTFNGAIIFRLPHLNLIQTIAYFPLLVWCFMKYVKNIKIRYLFLIPLFTSQMLIAGHTQAAFVSLCGLLLFAVSSKYIFRLPMKRYISSVIVLLILLVFGFSFATPQLLPSIVLSKVAIRSLELDYDTATLFPFVFKNLLNFINPFIFGNPKYGTYPPYSTDWGIFWENTPYVGVVMFAIWLLSFPSLIFLKNKKNLLRIFIVCNISFLVFVLCALGKSSPLYFIYNFPPFNMFRVPSKFLIPAVFFFFMAVSASIFFITQTRSKILKYLLFGLLCINLLDLLVTGYSYHLFVPSSALRVDKTLTQLDPRYNYISLGATEAWNTYFVKKGWTDKKSVRSYIFNINYLYPNSNLQFQKSTLDVNTPGLKLKRVAFIYQMLLSQIKIVNNQIEEITSMGKQLLDYTNTRYIISHYPFKAPEINTIDRITQGKETIYVGEVQQQTKTAAIYYFPDSATTVTYLQDLMQKLNETDLNRTAILEKSINTSYFNTFSDYKLTTVKQTENEYEFRYQSSYPKFLVIKVNNYPEWGIYVDGKKIEGYKVNLMHTGIAIDRGSHTVRVVYENNSVKKGVIIAVFTLPALIGFLYLLKRLQRYLLL